MDAYRKYHVYKHTGGWKSASHIIGKVIKRANQNNLNMHIEYQIGPDKEKNEWYLEFDHTYAERGDYIVQSDNGKVEIWSEKDFKEEFKFKK